MPRGKAECVYMICEDCKMQNYNARIMKKVRQKMEFKKYCGKCNASKLHKSGSQIKHSS